MQFLAGALCNPGEGMSNLQKAPLKQPSPEREMEGFQWEAPKNPSHLLPLPPRLLLHRIWGMQEGENSLLLFLGGVWVGFWAPLSTG